MSVKEPELSLSFVDLLSCSLGAMILLFLVFATMQHEGSEESDLDRGAPLPQAAAALGESSSEVLPDVPVLWQVRIKQLTASGAAPVLAILGMPDADVKLHSPNELSAQVQGESRWYLWLPTVSSEIQFEIQPANSNVEIVLNRLTGVNEMFQLGPVESRANAATLRYASESGWQLNR